MKFKCRRCSYFGNNFICPKCGSKCKLKFKTDDEQAQVLNIYSSLMDTGETDNLPAEFDPILKEMEQRHMIQQKRTTHNEPYIQKIQSPIWFEVAICILLQHHL